MQLRRRMHADAAAPRFRPLSSSRRGNGEEGPSLSSAALSASSPHFGSTQNLETESRASAVVATAASSHYSHHRHQASRNSHRGARTRSRGGASKTAEGGRGAVECRGDNDDTNKRGEEKREREDREEIDSLDSSSLAANTPVACAGRHTACESQSSEPLPTGQEREGEGGSDSPTGDRGQSLVCDDDPEESELRQGTERDHPANLGALPLKRNPTWRRKDEEGKRQRDEGTKVVQDKQRGRCEEPTSLASPPSPISASVHPRGNCKKTRSSISAASGSSVRRRDSCYMLPKSEGEQVSRSRQDSMESHPSSTYLRRRLGHPPGVASLPSVTPDPDCPLKKAGHEMQTTAPTGGRRCEEHKGRQGWNQHQELSSIASIPGVDPVPRSSPVSYSLGLPSSFLSSSSSPLCPSASPSSQALPPRGTPGHITSTSFTGGFCGRLASPDSPPPSPYFWLATSPPADAVPGAPPSFSSSSSTQYSLKGEKHPAEQLPWSTSACASNPLPGETLWNAPAADDPSPSLADDSGPEHGPCVQQPSSAGLRLPPFSRLSACTSCSRPCPDRTGSSVIQRYDGTRNRSAGGDFQPGCRCDQPAESLSASRDRDVLPGIEVSNKSTPAIADSRRIPTSSDSMGPLQNPCCQNSSAPEYRVPSLLQVPGTRSSSLMSLQNHSGEATGNDKLDTTFGALLGKVHSRVAEDKTDPRNSDAQQRGPPQQLWAQQNAPKEVVCSDTRDSKDETRSIRRSEGGDGQESEQGVGPGDQGHRREDESFSPAASRVVGSEPHMPKSTTTSSLGDSSELRSQCSTSGQQQSPSCPPLRGSLSGKPMVATDTVPLVPSCLPGLPTPCLSTSHTGPSLEDNAHGEEAICSEAFYNSSSEGPTQGGSQPRKQGNGRRVQSSYSVEYSSNNEPHSSAREKTCNPTTGGAGTTPKSPKGLPASPCENRSLPGLSLPQLPFPSHHPSPPGVHTSSNYMSLLPTLLQPSFPLFQSSSASLTAPSPPSSKDPASCPLPHQDAVALLPPSRVGMLDSPPSLSAPGPPPPTNSFPSSSSFSSSLAEPFVLGHSFSPALEPPSVSPSPLQNPSESLFVMPPPANGNAPGGGGPHGLLGASLPGQGGGVPHRATGDNMFFQSFPLSLAAAGGGDIMTAGPLALEPRGSGDGRLMLEQLDVLRSGASKDLYKRERTRVVDELIRQAVTYPKVSGIYFDKHQLRWSVGWAQHGRRVAKYFPVKIFGLAEGYRLAVHFKQAAVASAAANASALSSTATVIDPSTAFNSLSSLAASTQSHAPGPTASPVGLTPFLPPHPPPCPMPAPGSAGDLPLGVEDLQQRLATTPGVDASGRGLSAPGQLMPSSCGVPPLGQGGNQAGLFKQDPFLLQHMPMQATDHSHSPIPSFASLGSLPPFQESLSLPDLNGGVITSIETADRRVPPHRENETDTQRSTECSEEKTSGSKGEMDDAVVLRERGGGDPPGSSRSTPPGQDLPQLQQGPRQESDGHVVVRAPCHSSSLTVTEEEERGNVGANSLGQVSLLDAPREFCVSTGEIKGPLRPGERKLCTAANLGDQLSHGGSQRHGSPSTAWDGGGDVRTPGGAFAADLVSATESHSSFSKAATPVPFDTAPSVCCLQTEKANKLRQGERHEFDGGSAQELGDQKRSGSLCSSTRGTGTKARTETRREEYDQRPSWEFSAEHHPAAQHVTARRADGAVKVDSPERKKDREKDGVYCECCDSSQSHADRGSQSFQMKVEDRTGEDVSSHQAKRTQREEEDITALSTGRESSERKRGTSVEAQVEKKPLDEKREEMRKRRRESGTHSDEDPREGRRALRTSTREGSCHLNAVHGENSETPCAPQASLSARKAIDAFLYPPSRHHEPSRRSECGKVPTAMASVGPLEGGNSLSYSSPTMRDSIQKQRGMLPEEKADGFLSTVRTRRPKPDSCGNKDGEGHGNEQSGEPVPRAGEPGKEDRGETAMRETGEVTRFSSRTKTPQSRRSLPGFRHENGGDKKPSNPARRSDCEGCASPGGGGTETDPKCTQASSRLRRYSTSFLSSSPTGRYYSPTWPASSHGTRCPAEQSNNIHEKGGAEGDVGGLSCPSCVGISPPRGRALRSELHPPVLQHSTSFDVRSSTLQVETEFSSSSDDAGTVPANDESNAQVSSGALRSTNESSFAGLRPPCPTTTTATATHLDTYPESTNDGSDASSIVHRTPPTNSTSCPTASPVEGEGIGGLHHFGHDRSFGQSFPSVASTFSSSPPSTVSSPLSAPATAGMSVMTPSTSLSSLSTGTASGVCEIPTSSRQRSQPYTCHQLPSVRPLCGLDSVPESACRLVNSPATTAPTITESSGPPPLPTPSNSTSSSNSGGMTAAYYSASNLDSLEGAPSVQSTAEWTAAPAAPPAAAAAILNPSVNAAFMRGLHQNHTGFGSFPLALPLQSEASRSIPGSNVGCSGLLGNAGTLLTHTTGIHFDKHSLRWKATWYDTTGQRKAKYFPVGKYGYDQARRLAIQARQANHVPRSSRFAAAHAQQQVQLQQLLLQQQLLSQHHPCIANGPGTISTAPPALLSTTPPVAHNMLMTAGNPVTTNSSLGGQSCPRSDWGVPPPLATGSNSNAFLKDFGSLNTSNTFGDGALEAACVTPAGRGNAGGEDRRQRTPFRSQIPQKDAESVGSFGQHSHGDRPGLQQEMYSGEAHGASETAAQDTNPSSSVCASEGGGPPTGAKGDSSCGAFPGSLTPFFPSSVDAGHVNGSRRSSAGGRSTEEGVTTSTARPSEAPEADKKKHGGQEGRTEENGGNESGLEMTFPSDTGVDDEKRQELGSPAVTEGRDQGESLTGDTGSDPNAEGDCWIKRGGEERDGQGAKVEGGAEQEAVSLSHHASADTEDEEFKEVLVEEEYDEEKDKRLSQEPSRVLIRHASRLPRVSGIWFDKKQLRWACTFTDAVAGKRRAEYFPIRHFGFFGARRLAIQARRRMEKLRQEQKMQSHLSQAHFQEPYEHHQQQHPSPHTLLQHQHFFMQSRLPPEQQLAMSAVVNPPLCNNPPHPTTVLQPHVAPEGASPGADGGHADETSATTGLETRGADLPHLQRQQLIFLQLLEQTQHEHQRMSLGESRATTITPDGTFTDIQAAATHHPGETVIRGCSLGRGNLEAEKPCLQQQQQLDSGAGEQHDSFTQSFGSLRNLGGIPEERKEDGDCSLEKDTFHDIPQQCIDEKGNEGIGAESGETVHEVQNLILHETENDSEPRGMLTNLRTQHGGELRPTSESTQAEAERSCGACFDVPAPEKERDTEHAATQGIVGNEAVRTRLRRKADDDAFPGTMARRPRLRESVSWLATATGEKSQSEKESGDKAKDEQFCDTLQLEQNSVSSPCHASGALQPSRLINLASALCDKDSPMFAREAREEGKQLHCKSPSTARALSEVAYCDGARSSLFSRQTGKQEERNSQHQQQKPGREGEEEGVGEAKEDHESLRLAAQKPGDDGSSGVPPRFLETSSGSGALVPGEQNAPVHPLPATLPLASSGDSHRPHEANPNACEKDGAPLLTLERQAIRFLLLDLKNKCLANLAPLLLPAIFQRHYGHLVNHIRRVEYAISCEGLESFLLIFADCIKTMSLPSQLGVAEQVQMMGLVAALGEQLDAQGL
ncbi:ap2 domain transcription factor ap2ix-3 [Cystoisospora suis]|uniref:Ap2 domain transcription factor ap2ix-3 n=1 Tax=Cystoisospora suis TaxID=483139 RepID=A0A2C6L5T0_9APIC|nr:ap2 domain transcription factor ap2ix-3 [Cystoisospora suis]